MIQAIVTDQALQSIVLLTLIAALADFVTGVLAAIRTHTLSADQIAAFVSSHLLGRALPIILVASLASLLSAAVGGMADAPPVLAGAIAAAWAAAWAAVIAYVLETLASLQGNLTTVATATPPKPGA